MKMLSLILVSFLFEAHLTAQTENVNYNIWSVSVGVLLPSHPGKNVIESFPYTSTSTITGTTTSQSFNGSLNNSFSNTVYSGDVLNAEFVRSKHSIDIGFGINRDFGSNYGGYLKAGYRRVLTFNKFILKPGLDFYYDFGSEVNMGSIDNRDKDISLLGYTAKAQFSEDYTDPDSGITETDTYNSDHLKVAYQRSSFMANPKIILATKPKGRIYFGLEAGWMFQLAQTASIKLMQYDTDGNNNEVGSMTLENNGSLGGPYVAINIGVYL